jgi:anti-sigma factor RsiW
MATEEFMDRSLQHAFEAEEVMAYLDGELEPRRATMLASHLEHCAECQDVAKNFRSVTERMLGFDVEPAPEILAAAVLNAMKATQPNRSAKKSSAVKGMFGNWRGLFSNRIAWAVTAGVIVLLLAANIGTLRLFRNANPALPASRSAKFESSVSELKSDISAQNEAQISENAVAVNGRQFSPPSPSPAPGGELAAPESVGPMIVQTASLSIVAKNYDEASAAIQKLVTARGGYVERLDAKAQSGNARALSVALRIPAKQLDGFLTDLRKLGHVEEESQSNEEVSAEYVDLQARLKSAQATERRLIELLGTRTGKLEDVLDAERELARVRGEIESMQGQSAVLVHRVSYATVQVQLSEEYHEKLQSSASTGTKLWNAVVEGVQNLQDGIVGILIFVLNYGLSILFWLGAFAIPSWLIWRRLHARSAAKA